MCLPAGHRTRQFKALGQKKAAKAQRFMGVIMAVGVSILLYKGAAAAAVLAAHYIKSNKLWPIL